MKEHKGSEYTVISSLFRECANELTQTTFIFILLETISDLALVPQINSQKQSVLDINEFSLLPSNTHDTCS